MYEFSVREERRDASGCREECPRNPAGLYAGIYDADGYGVANIDRLGRRTGGNEVASLHEHIVGNDEPNRHATTDEQWQSILDCIAAAPQMLAACKAMVAAIDHNRCSAASSEEFHACKLLREAIAAAEPPTQEN